MWHKFTVSLYLKQDFNWAKAQKYLQSAYHYGCKEVFTSIHLPEFSFKEQMDFLSKLSALAQKEGMTITVDVGGNNFQKLVSYQDTYKDLKLDFIRLDYGFDPALLASLKQAYGLKGFILNASTVSAEELPILIQSLNKLNVEIRACHNFYPRPETGLAADFVKYQYRLFKSYNIPVACCVPNQLKPRLPLYAGLPTLEAHRYLNFTQILYSCSEAELADELLFGDETLSDEQLKSIFDVLQLRPFKVKVSLVKDISDTESDLILKKNHKFRYDSNPLILRSQTSREISEYGKYINARNTLERKAGSITIDNYKYLRYSGELQVVLKDLKADERVNVVARVKPEELWKFKYFRLINEYRFIAN